MLFTDLSMIEVSKMIGTNTLGTTLRTTLTLRSTILKCNLIVPIKETFWPVAFCKAGRLFVCIALRYLTARKYFRIR